jgi:hypothetical protein
MNRREELCVAGERAHRSVVEVVIIGMDDDPDRTDSRMTQKRFGRPSEDRAAREKPVLLRPARAGARPAPGGDNDGDGVGQNGSFSLKAGLLRRTASAVGAIAAKRAQTEALQEDGAFV